MVAALRLMVIELLSRESMGRKNYHCKSKQDRELSPDVPMHRDKQTQKQ
jgi:hypothetical protein